MEIELSEIIDFFSKYPPLDVLKPDELAEMVKFTQIKYYPKGLRQKCNPKDMDLWLIRSGALEVSMSGNLVEVCYEGSTQHHDLIEAKFNEMHFIEDTLIYIIDADMVTKYRQQSEAFRNYFHHDIRHHVEEAIQDTLEHTMHADVFSNDESFEVDNKNGDVDYVSHLSLKVEEIFKEVPICVLPSQSIKEAAVVMTDANVSSLLIVNESNEFEGIVTDSDLRCRAIVKDIPMNAPVISIASTDLLTVDAGTSVFEAMLLMTRHNIHHLPVMDKNNQAISMISSIDILNQQSLNSVCIVHNINKANTRERLIQETAHLPRLQLQMTQSGLSAEQVNRVFTLVSDEVIKKLSQLAIEKLGPAPAPFAFFVVGSQARGEMVANSDQDNCMVIGEDASEEDMAYFSQVADYICDGLNDAGFLYCTGNVMAKNEKWRQRISQWKQYYRDWINHNSPNVLMHAAIFFDMRFIDGDRALFSELEKFAREESQSNAEFLGRMSANALYFKPPLGFFRQFVLEQDGKRQELLDLKLKGLVPLNYLAQVLALAYGLKEQNTIARLNVVAAEHSFNKQISQDLIAAWQFIAYHRYKLQADEMQQGLPPSNKISPKLLSSLERKYLKDVFSAIKHAQEHFANHYRNGKFIASGVRAK